MSNAFGVQREVPSVEPPMGTNIIAQNFKTSKVNPSLIVNVQEDTTDAEPTEEELKTTTLSGDFDTNEDIEILKKMQEENTKFGDMQPIKESIFRKRRTIAKLEKDIKNGK